MVWAFWEQGSLQSPSSTPSPCWTTTFLLLTDLQCHCSLITQFLEDTSGETDAQGTLGVEDLSWSWGYWWPQGWRAAEAASLWDNATTSLLASAAVVFYSYIFLHHKKQRQQACGSCYWQSNCSRWQDLQKPATATPSSEREKGHGGSRQDRPAWAEARLRFPWVETTNSEYAANVHFVVWE